MPPRFIIETHCSTFYFYGQKVRYSLLHGYTKLEAEGFAPRFAFGEGKSYSQFSFARPTFWTKCGDGAGGGGESHLLCASIEVSNIGVRAGWEVVQFYVGFEGSAVLRPQKLLVAFKRVYVEPHKTQCVTLSVPLHRLRFFDDEKRVWVFEEGVAYQGHIGNSSKSTDLHVGKYQGNLKYPFQPGSRL